MEQMVNPAQNALLLIADGDQESQWVEGSQKILLHPLLKQIQSATKTEDNVETHLDAELMIADGAKKVHQPEIPTMPFTWHDSQSPIQLLPWLQQLKGKWTQLEFGKLELHQDHLFKKQLIQFAMELVNNVEDLLNAEPMTADGVKMDHQPEIPIMPSPWTDSQSLTLFILWLQQLKEELSMNHLLRTHQSHVMQLVSTHAQNA